MSEKDCCVELNISSRPQTGSLHNHTSGTGRNVRATTLPVRREYTPLQFTPLSTDKLDKQLMPKKHRSVEIRATLDHVPPEGYERVVEKLFLAENPALFKSEHAGPSALVNHGEPRDLSKRTRTAKVSILRNDNPELRVIITALSLNYAPLTKVSAERILARIMHITRAKQATLQFNGIAEGATPLSYQVVKTPEALHLLTAPELPALRTVSEPPTPKNSALENFSEWNYVEEPHEKPVLVLPT